MRSIGISAPIAEVNALYNDMDTDKSGSIEVDELLEKLAQLEPPEANAAPVVDANSQGGGKRSPTR